MLPNCAQEGYSALTAIAGILSKKPEPPNKNTLLASETNKFFTLIPHEFGGKPPPIIDSEELLKAKIALMDTLTELEVATSLFGDGDGKGAEGVHPIDLNYGKLKCELQPVDKKSDEFKLIAEYVKNTHGHTHTAYTLELEDLFTMAREVQPSPTSATLHRPLLPFTSPFKTSLKRGSCSRLLSSGLQNCAPPLLHNRLQPTSAPRAPPICIDIEGESHIVGVNA